MLHLLKQSRVIQQRAAERDRITRHRQRLRQNEWRIQQPRRLRRRKLRRNVHPRRRIQRPVERRIFNLQTPPEPDQRHQKQHRGQKLRRIRNERQRMRRTLRRKTPQQRRDSPRHHDNREQCAGNFEPRPPRTWQKMLDEQRYNKQQSQHDAPNPPRHRRPAQMNRRFLQKLEKQQARRRQQRAAQQKSRTENKRDAILRALEANESDGGENKR